MIVDIDTKVIDLFDGVATAIQRRGLLPLNTLIMVWACLFWSTFIVQECEHVTWFSYVMAAGAAFGLYGAYYGWRQAHGYWEDARKALRLNAAVLYSRERLLIMRMSVWPLVAILDLPSGSLLRCINGGALLCLSYLMCCRYLGPGDFAREKRERVSGALQEGIG